MSNNFENPKFIQFLFQITMLFIVCIISIVNLTLGTPHYEVWIFLLSTSLGVVIPQPKVKKMKHSLLSPPSSLEGITYSPPPPATPENNLGETSSSQRFSIEEEEEENLQTV